MTIELCAVLCDTHVHLYDFNDLDRLLDSAIRNFQHVQIPAGEARPRYVLVLTDGKADQSWPHVLDLAISGQRRGNWTFSAHGGDSQPKQAADNILIVASNGLQRIWMVPGRQILSEEGLELLLLGCSAAVADGVPAAKLVETHSTNYLIVFPWAAGKWLGSRGQLLSALIDSHGSFFWVGDNGGRPALWGRVPHFLKTRSTIINGTDPLPLTNDCVRVGSYGMKFYCKITDFDGVNHFIAAMKTSFPTAKRYGKSLGLVRFIINQIKLRIGK